MKVTYDDHMGSDLKVVNMARVSFGKRSTSFTKEDASLIAFLARGCTSGDWDKLVYQVQAEGVYGPDELTEFRSLLNHIKKMPSHWAPFSHCHTTLHMKVPIFIARQIHKHQVGFEVSEVSRRYVSDTPEFYGPEVWRKAPEGSVKQGSSDESVDVAYYDRDDGYNDWPTEATSIALEAYQEMLKLGVCPEQARMVLPQSMYTEFYMTGSLNGWARMYNQRSDSHAQKEIQEVAKQINDIMGPLFPVSWKALTT